MKSDLDRSKILVDAIQLNDCKTSEQVHSVLLHLSNQLGFDAFLYGGRFNLDGTRQVEKVESSYRESWRQQYDKLGYAQIDPTVSHAVTSLRPLVWLDRMYVTDAQRDFQEEARSHGLLAGATFPVQSKEGEVAMLSLALSSSGREAQRHVQEMLVWGPLVATLAHEAMRNIVKNAHASILPKLTKRETEVLKWIAAGKSTWEISKLIIISEHGVIHHVRNILLKFDVPSRHHAVAKAIALGAML